MPGTALRIRHESSQRRIKAGTVISSRNMFNGGSQVAIGGIHRCQQNPKFGIRQSCAPLTLEDCDASPGIYLE